MDIISLKPEHINELLELEGKMYWQSEKWKDLWNKRARDKFKIFIDDYLTNFPKGCFGIVEDGKILGAMFLTKIAKLKTIPYFHKFSEYFEPNGKIAYVSFFVIKEGEKNEREAIAFRLYDYVTEVAIDIHCKTIESVIYSSPIEEKALKGNNYEKLEGRFDWEIYLGKKVSSDIYYYNLSMDPS